MLKKMTILSALLALVLVDLLQAQGTPVTLVLEALSVEQSRDPSVQPSTEVPLDYSRDPHKEEGTEQAGSAGAQDGEQATWELSGEPNPDSTPKPSVEPSKEPAQESTTEISEYIATLNLDGKATATCSYRADFTSKEHTCSVCSKWDRGAVPKTTACRKIVTTAFSSRTLSSSCLLYQIN